MTNSQRTGAWVTWPYTRTQFVLVDECVGLTHQHTNRSVLVEGPEITIRPVGTRRLVAGDSR